MTPDIIAALEASRDVLQMVKMFDKGTPLLTFVGQQQLEKAMTLVSAALSTSPAGQEVRDDIRDGSTNAGVDRETAAWAWLDRKFGTENDDPVDRAYDASEMVDAFHAGHAYRLAALSSPSEGESATVSRERPSFEQVWATKEAEGYQYGEDALEQVRFGWELAVDALGATSTGENG